MKTKNMFLSILLLSFVVSGYTQLRGFQQIKLQIDGQSTTLYSGSHALVIGVSNYTNGWSYLDGVKNDIYKVKSALEKHDFNVVLVENPGSKELKAAFEDFISKYGRSADNRLLIYFSGHGHTLTKGWGGDMGYIVPSDAPRPDRDINGFMDKALDMESMEVYAKNIDSKHALFMFDCCFSGSVFSMSRAAPAVINYKTKEPVRQFITAGTANEEVPDKSIFCSEFLEALKGAGDSNKDGFVTGSELGDYLQNSVINYSEGKYHPQYGKINNAQLDKGDFVFVLPKQAEPVTRPSVVVTEEKITRYGSIVLTTEIAGSLYLDGTFLQSIKEDTRLTLKDVTTGSHTLKITGDETWQESVFVTENTTAQAYAKAIPKTDTKRPDYEPEMVFVKGGTFTMGSNDGNDREKPTHQVTVSDFYIGKYEVTQKQWCAVMGASSLICKLFKDCDNCPVERVNWNDIQEFIKKLNQKTGKTYRLPTEAEWEYAARGGASTGSFPDYMYSGSNNIDEVAWYGSNSGNKTHPVGQKKPNELGIYDMTGNVCEWCSDRSDNDYYKNSPNNNPKGPASGDYQVVRGGSCDFVPYDSRITSRSRNHPDNGLYYRQGFRLAQDY